MGNYANCLVFENPRRGGQARNFTTNVPKILDLKSSSEQPNRYFPKIDLGCPCKIIVFPPKRMTPVLSKINKNKNKT